MNVHLPSRQGVGAQVIHSNEEHTYDVGLHTVEEEFNVWLNALRGAVKQFVGDAERVQREAGREAVKKAIEEVNLSLSRLVNEVYRREVQ